MGINELNKTYILIGCLFLLLGYSYYNNGILKNENKDLYYKIYKEEKNAETLKKEIDFLKNKTITKEELSNQIDTFLYDFVKVEKFYDVKKTNVSFEKIKEIRTKK